MKVQIIITKMKNNSKTVNHYLKLGFKISGPIPVDTVFLKILEKTMMLLLNVS